MDYSRILTIEPGKRGGKPCIRVLRITVYDVLSYLAAGMSIDEVLADSPDLTVEEIRACLREFIKSLDMCYVWRVPSVVWNADATPAT